MSLAVATRLSAIAVIPAVLLVYIIHVLRGKGSSIHLKTTFWIATGALITGLLENWEASRAAPSRGFVGVDTTQSLPGPLSQDILQRGIQKLQETTVWINHLPVLIQYGQDLRDLNLFKGTFNFLPDNG